MRAWWLLYDAHREALGNKLRAVAMEIPDFAPVLRALTPPQIARQEAVNAPLQRAAVVDGDWIPYLEHTRQQGAGYARAGVGFSAWFELTSKFRADMLDLLERELTDFAAYARAVAGMNRYCDMALAEIGEGYLETKQVIIGEQQQAIRELSTPVLQVLERLLILPVVGVVDTLRARQLTEELLAAIRDRRARVVVMDVTGVPIVDSKVANHLVQSVEAARLMGATVIVTGISAEIAQTLVTIGADLRNIQTLGDLQGGLEEAWRILGYRVFRPGDHTKEDG
jgi:anti-anti-sigma regulatory factor